VDYHSRIRIYQCNLLASFSIRRYQWNLRFLSFLRIVFVVVVQYRIVQSCNTLYQGTNVENTDLQRNPMYTKPVHHHSKCHFNTDLTLAHIKVIIIIVNVDLIANKILHWLAWKSIV
jgi:hypothetical protein